MQNREARAQIRRHVWRHLRLCSYWVWELGDSYSLGIMGNESGQRGIHVSALELFIKIIAQMKAYSGMH